MAGWAGHFDSKKGHIFQLSIVMLFHECPEEKCWKSSSKSGDLARKPSIARVLSGPCYHITLEGAGLNMVRFYEIATGLVIHFFAETLIEARTWCFYRFSEIQGCSVIQDLRGPAVAATFCHRWYVFEWICASNQFNVFIFIFWDVSGRNFNMSLKSPVWAERCLLSFRVTFIEQYFDMFSRDKRHSSRHRCYLHILLWE